MKDPLRFRQSRLRGYVTCPRRTVLDDDFTAGFVGSSADLGSAFHAVAAEILRTLKRQEEPRMATEDAVVIMREVLDAGPWVLDADDDKWLRQMVLAFAFAKWTPSLILAIEDRLTMDLPCPDGEIRTLSGTPDLVIAEPPSAAVIVDQKTGMGVPRTPREAPPEDEPIRGEEYMSEGAMFQLYVYGALVMSQWPRVERVTLREQNWRWLGPAREATMSRDDLEHVLPYIARVMMQLDTALREGEDHPLSQPRPGAHCTTRCPVAHSCPIPREQRGLGVLETPEDAVAEAGRWTVIRALDKQMREALKARHESTGEFIPVDGGTLGWHVKDNGKRAFEIR